MHDTTENLSNEAPVTETNASFSLSAFAPVALLSALGLIFSAIYYNYSNDDSYITYRYAYNLAHGSGFVFNPGERYLGTSTPLYGLLLGLLGMTGVNIPFLSGCISGLSMTMGGIALLVLGRQQNRSLCGWLAGFFWIVNPAIGRTFGSEMTFQVMLIAWAFVAYFRGKTYPAALLLALALLTRGDSLSAILAMGTHSLLVRRRVPWREALLILAVLLPFFLLSKNYYGAFLPATLGAKAAQTKSGYWPPFTLGVARSFKHFARRYSYFVFSVPFALFGLALLRPLSFKRAAADAQAFGAAATPSYAAAVPSWRLPLAWPLLFTALYTLMGIPYYPWYVTTLHFGHVILTAIGVEGFLSACRKRYPATADATAARFAFAVALGVFVLLQVRIGLYQKAHPDPRRAVYLAASDWVKSHTAPDATLGFYEVGYVGYFANHRLIDGYGLVTPDVYPHIASKEMDWAYRRYQPNYVFCTPPFEEVTGVTLPSSWFNAHYRKILTMAPQAKWPLTIYQRIGYHKSDSAGPTAE